MFDFVFIVFLLVFEFIFFLFNVYLVNLPNKQSVLIHLCCELPTTFVCVCVLMYCALAGTTLFSFRLLTQALLSTKSNFNKPPLCIISIVYFISIIITFEMMVTEQQYECFMWACVCVCPQACSFSNVANLTCSAAICAQSSQRLSGLLGILIAVFVLHFHVCAFVWWVYHNLF